MKEFSGDSMLGPARDRFWRRAVIAYGTALATWLVLSLGWTSALNLDRPFAAVAIYGGDATTRLLVDRQLDPQPNVAAKPDALAGKKTRATATAALAANPLSVEAFGQLARAAQQSGDNRLAEQYLVETFRRSFRESDVAVQLLQASLAKVDYDGVLLYSDALLRTRPELLSALNPVLMAIGDQPAARAALIATLRAQPPWRSNFLTSYGNVVKNDEAFVDIYKALKDTESPLTSAELRPFLFNLVQQNKIDTALTIWLASQPDALLAKLPLLYNGDFSAPVNDSPFNWTVSEASGATIRINDAPGEHGKKALSIEFLNRREDFRQVSQILALTPGKYRFSGQVKTDDFQNSRGLVWRVYCGIEATNLIAESPRFMNDGSSWRPFSASFEIPSAKCPAQVVRLELAARIPLELVASGSVWFDDLSIAPDR